MDGNIPAARNYAASLLFSGRSLPIQPKNASHRLSLPIPTKHDQQHPLAGSFCPSLTPSFVPSVVSLYLRRQSTRLTRWHLRSPLVYYWSGVDQGSRTHGCSLCCIRREGSVSLLNNISLRAAPPGYFVCIGFTVVLAWIVGFLTPYFPIPFSKTKMPSTPVLAQCQPVLSATNFFCLVAFCSGFSFVYTFFSPSFPF